VCEVLSRVVGARGSNTNTISRYLYLTVLTGTTNFFVLVLRPNRQCGHDAVPGPHGVASALQSPLFAYPQVFTAVTMKNAVVWNKKPSSYLTGGALPLRYRAHPVNAIEDLRFSLR
jgi:hypothetical protein